MLNSGTAEMSQCSGLGGHVPSQLIRGYFSGARDGLQGLCECVFVYVGACVHNKTCLPPSKRKGPTCSSGYPDRHGLRPLLPRPPVSAVELKGYMHSEMASLWSPFCLGRPGVRYEGRGLRQASVGQSVTSVLRFLAGPWHSGSEAHCFASAWVLSSPAQPFLCVSGCLLWLLSPPTPSLFVAWVTLGVKQVCCWYAVHLSPSVSSAWNWQGDPAFASWAWPGLSLSQGLEESTLGVRGSLALNPIVTGAFSAL